ncbi:hypothetical protein [Mucilaginibacter sp. L3T2-6]|nr:hypothetical protein [Mucilaginibacter sp. L3T2-6]MDO3641765.1 hypothetical protein [Mucilaginibacter sp. L3T2-6]MDV6214259.1 hypothetical protein [Mucilaginibacter sp. L3T2-6]
MKKVQILTNQNKIYSEVTTNASYANECGEFWPQHKGDGKP